MAPPTKIQNADEAIRWIKEGRSYAWMTAEHERKYNIRISASGWSYFRGKNGLDARAVSDEELVPWSVKHQHRNNYYLYCLRQEGRRRHGKKLDEHAETRVNAFLRDLAEQRVVVDYDPSTENGFRLVLREAQDEGSLVRRPAKTGARRRRGPQ
ncbi:hypothetical protein AB0K35_28715 [Micromonospora sp. NPDC053740]|uniref:hypothetical protein n=1 Tax=Micromonospora TaxID=1873 RepID=UPI001EE8F161|nr:hypothetical protein [Micromonospora alfalfae]MCG5464098.1 hypothetical protein [Micromonospora alfalfae]